MLYLIACGADVNAIAWAAPAGASRSSHACSDSEKFDGGKLECLNVSPLMWLVRNRNSETAAIRVLLGCGADPTLTDAEGNSGNYYLGELCHHNLLSFHFIS
jgi:hypothetical protein